MVDAPRWLNPELTIEDLDDLLFWSWTFPTPAITSGRKGIEEDAYRNRSWQNIHACSGRNRKPGDSQIGKETIYVHEIPYQVKQRTPVLIEIIAELVKEKKIEGISSLTVMNLNKDGMPYCCLKQNVTNQPKYYWNSFVIPKLKLQTVFGIHMVALDKKNPAKIMNSDGHPQGVLFYIRREVVTDAPYTNWKKREAAAYM